MADIVDLSAHRKAVDPDLVESLRVLLSEAQNGRITGIVAAYYDDEGSLCSMFHMDAVTDAIAATVLLHHEVLAVLTEE